jgi:hypothetical protein
MVDRRRITRFSDLHNHIPEVIVNGSTLYIFDTSDNFGAAINNIKHISENLNVHFMSCGIKYVLRDPDNIPQAILVAVMVEGFEDVYVDLGKTTMVTIS